MPEIKKHIQDPDVDFLSRCRNDTKFMLRCSQAAFDWAEECKKKKVKKNIMNAIMNNAVRNDYSVRTELAFKYYILAGYSRTEINEKLKAMVFAEETKAFEETAKCCSAPSIVSLSEYSICDNCKTKVDGSDVLTSNYTDTAVSAPNKLFQNSTDSSDSRTVVGKAVNRWSGIERLILRIQGQHSKEYKEKWDGIYTRVTRGLEDEKMIKAIPYDEVVRRLAGTNCTKDAPVIWEAITGNKLPRLSDEVLWVIQHVICKQLKEQDEEDLKTCAGYKPPNIKPQAIFYKCLELCDCPEFFPFLMFNKNGLTPEINRYWKRHCEIANWRT